MPRRLIRRCLLFALLGLMTSVAVAWGLSVRDQVWWEYEFPNDEGVAVLDDTIVRLDITRRRGFRSERWLLDDAGSGDRLRYEAAYIRAHGGAAYADWQELMRTQTVVRHGGGEPRIRTPPARIDDRAALGPPVPLDSVTHWPTSVWRISVGWPLLAMESGRRAHTIPFDPKLHKWADSRRVVSHNNDVQVQWPWPRVRDGQHAFSSRRPGPTSVRLPLAPRPGLAGNTLFYAALWALLLLAPGAILRQIRRGRNRCPKCAYSLHGQPAPGCPECGAGRDHTPAAA